MEYCEFYKQIQKKKNEGNCRNTKLNCFAHIRTDQKIRKKGYIKKYVSLLDNKLIQRSATAICMVSLRYHHEGFIDKFETQIKALDEIQECYHMAGKVDFFLKLNLQSIAEYHEFVRSKLSKIENIGVLESYFVLKEMFHTTEFHI